MLMFTRTLPRSRLRERRFSLRVGESRPLLARQRRRVRRPCRRRRAAVVPADRHRPGRRSRSHEV